MRGRCLPGLLSGRRAALEWLVVCLLTPLLAFPSQAGLITMLGLCLLLIHWGFQLWRGTFGLPDSPLVWPTVALGVMVAVGVWTSRYPDLSLPKWTGVVLGVLWMRAILLTCAEQRCLRRLVAVYLALGIVLTVVGMVGTCVPCWVDKIGPLRPLALRIPQVFVRLPGTELGGVNPNALGATTLFFIPLLTALYLFWPPRDPRASRARAMALRTAVAVLLLAFLLVLVISQSRTSWLSAIVSTGLIAVVRWRFLRRAGAALLAAGAVVLIGICAVNGTEVVLHDGSRLALQAIRSQRVQIWSTAIDHIRRAPLRGVGLNAFRREVYGTAALPVNPGAEDIAHAHNVFLQTALDVGIPGLVAYVALLLVAGSLCRRAYRDGTIEQKGIALGLAGTLVAIHLFGLTDAVALGAKIGLCLWFTLGMIGALQKIVSARGQAGGASSRPDGPGRGASARTAGDPAACSPGDLRVPHTARPAIHRERGARGHGIPGGLPDLCAPVKHSDSWPASRRFQAVRKCYRALLKIGVSCCEAPVECKPMSGDTVTRSTS